jgi:Cu/Ag efflux protein CusF
MRSLLTVLLFVFTSIALAQPEGIEKGKIKKIDADKLRITITQDGKERDFLITEDTRVAGAEGKDAKSRLKTLKEGIEVFFKPVRKDDKDVLVGIKPIDEKSTNATPGGIEKGKVKKIDLDRMTVTLTQDGKEREFVLTEDTRVLSGEGKTVKERFKNIKEGIEVQFKPGRKDGKDVLAGIKVAGESAPPPKQPKVDTSKLKPLTDLGKEEYQGFPGGLYPNGKNERPAAHEKAGLALAKKVQPLDADGKPDPKGKIVLLSVGMSNTSQDSEGFRRLLAKEEDKNPQLVFINGAQGGMTAKAIQDPSDKGSGTRYWDTVDRRLQEAGVSRAQVQAVWIKEADARPMEGFPKYAQTLQAELTKIVQLLPERFPNVKLVYLSSRTYAGYATTPLNPEPYAYESGFSVKWLIEEQLKGEAALNHDPAKGKVKAPWLSWGPYLWANGASKRSDGLSYAPEDFSSDGTHPSSAGVEKVAAEMLRFFKSDSTTKPWFVRPQ